MIGILADQHLGDRRLGRQSTFNEADRCRSLHHHAFTSPAAVFGTMHHQHAELRRDDVEPFAHVLADPVQFALAAWAARLSDVDGGVDPWQMLRQRPAIAAALSGCLRPHCRGYVFRIRRSIGFRLLGFFKA